jgi:hypothetical protein
MNAEGRDDAQFCRRPDLNRSVTAYCFGEATASDREDFEAHLLECDFCWAEVQRLGRAVRLLRSDRQLTRSVFTVQIATCLGISGKLRRPLGGHWIHVVVASALYALLFAVALPLEVAYQFDRYGRQAVEVSFVLFAWVFLTTVLAVFVDWRAVISGVRTGLLYSIGCAFASALVLYLAVHPFLPAKPITEATFQTYTAQSAYLKSVFYYLPYAFVFVFTPFHFVLAMQSEFAAGRHGLGFGLLTGSRPAVPPRGAIFLRLWVLGGLLLLGTIASIIMAAHLLDNLKQGAYTNLFVHILQLRWGLYMGLGIEALVWYYFALTELKREALAIDAISVATRRPRA